MVNVFKEIFLNIHTNIHSITTKRFHQYLQFIIGYTKMEYKNMEISYNNDVKNLMDLPEEILEKILYNLNTVTLMVVHDVNTVFRRISLKLIPEHKNYYTDVNFDNFDNTDSCRVICVDGKYEFTGIYGFHNMLRCIRHFSSYMNVISIDFKNVSKIRQTILLRYIFKHCHKIVTQLVIHNLNITDQFRLVRFDRLEYVHLHSCKIRGTLTYFAKIFPNIKEIKITGNCRFRKTEIINIVQKYPNLEYMRVPPYLLDVRSYIILTMINSQAFFSNSG